MNLESVYEQMKATTTQKMASILSLTDRYFYIFSSYVLGKSVNDKAAFHLGLKLIQLNPHSINVRSD